MIKYSLINKVTAPTRAHSTDAGLDFYLPEEHNYLQLKPFSDALIPTGVILQLPKKHVGVFLNKSSVATRHKLVIGAQVIDEGYIGEIHVHLINTDNRYITLSPGMKIAQLLIMPIIKPKIVEVDKEYFENLKTERGQNGFGSTG